MKRKHYLLAVEKDGAVFYAQRNPDCLKGYRLVRDKAKAETFGEEIRKIWLKVYPSGSAEEVSGPIRPDRPAKAPRAPRAPRAEKARKPKPPLKMTRKVALDLIMVAGYEGDRARATRLLIENRISKAAADEAFRRGAAKKAAEEQKAASVSEPLELAPDPSRALELAPAPSGKTEIPWNEAQERDARADKKGAAIVLMDPDIFLELTTADAAQVRAIRDAAKPIDTYLSPEVQKNLLLPPFITIDPNRDNKIVSHEGRHRAAAVVNAGGKAFKVLIRTAEEGQDLPSSMRFQFVPGKEYPLKTLEKVGSLRVLENLAKQRKERAFSSYMAEKRQKTEELAERLKKFAPGSIAIQILPEKERVFRKENVLEDSWNEIRKSAEGWEPVPGGNIYEDVILRGYRTTPGVWEFIDSADPKKGFLTVDYRRIVPTPRPAEPRLSDDSMFTLVKGDDQPPVGFEPVTPEAVPTDRTRDQVRMWLTQRTGRIPALRPGMSLARYGELVTEAADKAHALMMRHGGRVFVYFKPASVSEESEDKTRPFVVRDADEPKPAGYEIVEIINPVVRNESEDFLIDRYRKEAMELPIDTPYQDARARNDFLLAKAKEFGKKLFADLATRRKVPGGPDPIVYYRHDPERARKIRESIIEKEKARSVLSEKMALSPERTIVVLKPSKINGYETPRNYMKTSSGKFSWRRLRPSGTGRGLVIEELAYGTEKPNELLMEILNAHANDPDKTEVIRPTDPRSSSFALASELPPEGVEYEPKLLELSRMLRQKPAELLAFVESFNKLSAAKKKTAKFRYSSPPLALKLYANHVAARDTIRPLENEGTIVLIESRPQKGYTRRGQSTWIFTDGKWKVLRSDGQNYKAEEAVRPDLVLEDLEEEIANAPFGYFFSYPPGSREQRLYLDQSPDGSPTEMTRELLREFLDARKRKRDAPAGVIKGWRSPEFHHLFRAVRAGWLRQYGDSKDVPQFTDKGREALA